jgi:hypothetical protein
MSTPFRVRITEPGNAPPWLRDGTGERLEYSFGALVDMRLEKVRQGILDRLPVERNPYDRASILWVPQADALARLGSDRGITRGLTESDLSYGFRLQRAFDSWRFAGTSRGLLMQILGYLLAYTPTVRFVSASYDRSVWPPTLGTTTWASYPAGRDPNIEPVTVRATTDPGVWNWDGSSPITGSWGFWSGYLIIYATAPNDWCHPADDWGTGSVYTAGPEAPYYSTVSGGAYVLDGSYTGTSQAWGAGSTYTPDPTNGGYYSTVVNGAYTLAGTYSGESQAWGVDVGGFIGQSLQIIAKQFKGAGCWIRSIIVSFDDSLLTPDGSAGVENPDGTWGQWSIVSGDAYLDTRSFIGNIVFGGEVV